MVLILFFADRQETTLTTQRHTDRNKFTVDVHTCTTWPCDAMSRHVMSHHAMYIVMLT